MNAALYASVSTLDKGQSPEMQLSEWARFYLFGKVQDFSYALPDPDAAMSRRHHLRIWKTDYTIDGTPIWAASATHDVAIEIAKRGRLINHRIDPAIDVERDFVGTSLTDALSVSWQEYLHCVDPVFQLWGYRLAGPTGSRCPGSREESRNRRAGPKLYCLW